MGRTPSVPHGTARDRGAIGAGFDEGRAARAVEQPVVHGDADARPCRSNGADVGRNIERDRLRLAVHLRWSGFEMPLPLMLAQSRSPSRPSTTYPCWIWAPTVPPNIPPLILKLERSNLLEKSVSGSCVPPAVSAVHADIEAGPVVDLRRRPVLERKPWTADRQHLPKRTRSPAALTLLTPDAWRTNS